MWTSLSPSERSYIITGLSHPTHPTRLDGRPLLSPRPLTISYGDAPQASGSARVVIDGGTEVVAGIRLEVTDVDPRAGKGKEGWKGRVEVDVWVCRALKWAAELMMGQDTASIPPNVEPDTGELVDFVYEYGGRSLHTLTPALPHPPSYKVRTLLHILLLYLYLSSWRRTRTQNRADDSPGTLSRTSTSHSYPPPPPPSPSPSS
jgi:hypothetical protein